MNCRVCSAVAVAAPNVVIIAVSETAALISHLWSAVVTAARPEFTPGLRLAMLMSRHYVRGKEMHIRVRLLQLVPPLLLPLQLPRIATAAAAVGPIAIAVLSTSVHSVQDRRESSNSIVHVRVT